MIGSVWIWWNGYVTKNWNEPVWLIFGPRPQLGFLMYKYAFKNAPVSTLRFFVEDRLQFAFNEKILPSLNIFGQYSRIAGSSKIVKTVNGAFLWVTSVKLYDASCGFVSPYCVQILILTVNTRFRAVEPSSTWHWKWALISNDNLKH